MSDLKPLADRHAELIRASGISDEVRDARGYWTAAQKYELRDLGFSERQQRVPALVLPVHGVAGNLVLHQIRPDQPRHAGNGKPIKYETPRDARMVLDVPPTVRPLLGDPTVPLLITEGIRKADAAASVSLCCVDLLGVWSWRGSNEAGGKIALPDWEHIARNGRAEYLVFDSDVMVKDLVHASLARLKVFSESRSAVVRMIYLPSGENGAKVGLDDYLAAGHSKDELLSLATDQLRRPDRPDVNTGSSWQAGAYTMTESGIVYDRPTREGTVELQLTNFAARISHQVTEDDGAEQRLVFEMQAQMKGRARTFEVAASQFASLSWVTEHLGGEAIIWPGQISPDHARVAIQLLSGQIAERHVFTYTGWCVIDEQAVYLHRAGAVGPEGLHPGTETRLEGGLAGYQLPEPPAGEELREAIRASLRILDVAPERVMLPLLAMVYRAPLGQADFSVWLVGPTGAGKSELAALAVQHWGPSMDRLHLPASWSSTGNALEGLAFQAKDVVLPVDDFAPNGTSHDIQRIHREAERLLRAQGNASARQ
jgi:hypothetical protein